MEPMQANQEKSPQEQLRDLQLRHARYGVAVLVIVALVIGFGLGWVANDHLVLQVRHHSTVTSVMITPGGAR